MSNKIDAKEILDKIERMEKIFKVNDDIEFTKIIKEKINNTNWQDINLNNKEILNNIKKSERNQIADTSYIAELNLNKDITQKIPENTRLKFIKKAINKVIKVTTRYQESFNNTLVNCIANLLKRIGVLEKENYNNKIMIEKLNSNLMFMLKDKEELETNLENVMLMLKDKEELETNLENAMLMLKDKDEFEKYIVSNNKRIDGDEAWCKLLSERIDGLESMFTKLRNELFAEIKYNSKGLEITQSNKIMEPKILKSYEEYLKKYGDIKKVNLGCGTITKSEYINIDERELDGVNVVANVTNLPFNKEELDEIYAAHLLEHFEEEFAINTLLPYWYSLLKKGGKIRIIVPNIDEMINLYKNLEIDFSQLKEIIFGGQEYSGNYHFTMFNVETLTNILSKVGFNEINVITTSRKNGMCLEMEIEGIKK